MKQLNHNVSFRLNERSEELLKGRAALLGTSPNLAARKLVEESLNQNETALLDGLNLLAKTVLRMGEELSARIDQLAEGQTGQGRELLKLKESIRRDLEKVAAAITSRK